MSILLGSMIEKHGMIQWIKETANRFVLPYITAEQRAMLQRHVNQMEAFPGIYEVKCEVAQGAGGNAMRLTINIHPAGPVQ